MVDMNKAVCVVLTTLVAVTMFQGVVSASASQGSPCSMEVIESVNKYAGGDAKVEYEIGFDEETRRVCVSAQNVGNMSTYFGISIRVDDRTIPTRETTEFDPGESIVVKRNITTWLNASADNHWVSVGTFGPNHRFNFTERINESNEGGIPTPFIKNVTVFGESGGEDTILQVSVINPANRTYAPNVMIRTSETASSSSLGEGSNGSIEYFRFHLEEGENETIVGSARLYRTEGVKNGKFDKKEFVVNPNGSAEIWDKQIEKVPSLNEVSEQEYYKNQSALRFRGEGPEANPEARQAGRVAAVAGIVLVGVLGWFRYR